MKKILYELIINNNVQILKNNIDWYVLLSCAIAERVEGQLFKFFLDNNLLDNLPNPIKKTLFISFQYNHKKNALYVKEFKNIQKILSANGLSVFPYKGLFLIEHIYKNYGVRYMEDMDIISFETSYLIIEKILKEINYQLALINDINFSLYIPESQISSCLFIKRYPVTNLVPLAKLDITFMPVLLGKNNISYCDNGELSFQNNFYLLCDSLYKDACEKSKSPVPQDCSLMKLIDIFTFIKRYPQKTEQVLNNEPFSHMKFIKYTQQCIKYYSKKDII